MNEIKVIKNENKSTSSWVIVHACVYTTLLQVNNRNSDQEEYYVYRWYTEKGPSHEPGCVSCNVCVQSLAVNLQVH